MGGLRPEAAWGNQSSEARRAEGLIPSLWLGNYRNLPIGFLPNGLRPKVAVLKSAVLHRQRPKVAVDGAPKWPWITDSATRLSPVRAVLRDRDFYGLPTSTIRLATGGWLWCSVIPLPSRSSLA